MRLTKFMPILLAVMIFSSPAKSKDLTPLDTTNIKDQFNWVIKKSTQYNDYRVVKSTYFYSLKSHVFDSIDGLKSKIKITNAQLASETLRIDSLNNVLEATKNDLAQVTEIKDSIKLIGIEMNKASYNGLMWTLSIGLLVLLLIFILLFKRSNYTTVQTKNDLEEVKEELENYRKRSREREEKIVRKLHDEINRYKKRVYQLEKSTQS